MRPTQELAPERWAQYLDDVTEDLLNDPVSIEIIDASAHPTLQDGHLALQGLAYDPWSDTFEVDAAEGGPSLPHVVSHFVDHPARIAADGFTPTTIVVDGRDGARTVITIEHPPAFSG